MYLRRPDGLVLCGMPDRTAREKTDDMGVIAETTVQSVIDQLTEKYGEGRKDMIQRGVSQTAALWKAEDGDATVFETFCLENYQGTTKPAKACSTSSQEIMS